MLIHEFESIKTMQQVKDNNAYIGHCWFGKGTLKWWNGKVYDRLYRNPYNQRLFFISSERCDVGLYEYPRVWGIREVLRDGSIQAVDVLGNPSCLGDSIYTSHDQAKRAVKKLLS